MLTLLAAGGADPRLAAAYGETPLVVAVVGRNAHLVRTLLVFGAGVDERRAKDGASVRHLAAANAAVCLQQQRQQRQPPPPKDAQERAEILEHLISFGARPCSQLGPLPAEKTEARATPCVEGCLVDQQEAVAQQLNAVYGEPFQPLAAHRLAAEAILEESRRRKKGEKEEGSNSSSSSEGQKTPVMMICFDGKFRKFLKNLFNLSFFLLRRRRPRPDHRPDSPRAVRLPSAPPTGRLLRLDSRHKYRLDHRRSRRQRPHHRLHSGALLSLQGRGSEQRRKRTTARAAGNLR